jgi:hypothetical protein
MLSFPSVIGKPKYWQQNLVRSNTEAIIGGVAASMYKKGRSNMISFSSVFGKPKC